MAWQRRRREVSDEERRQAVEDYRVEVQRFQWKAYRNFRWAVAGACIFLGLVGLRSMFDSREGLAANILMVVGAVGGAVSFLDQAADPDDRNAICVDRPPQRAGHRGSR